MEKRIGLHLFNESGEKRVKIFLYNCPSRMEQYRQRNRKINALVSGMMGICYVILAGVLFFHQQLHLHFSLDNTFIDLFAAIVLIYGGFRIVKSWKSYFSYSEQSR